MPRKIQLSEAPPRWDAEMRSNVYLGDGIYCIRLFCKQVQTWTPGDCIAVYSDDNTGISRPYSLSGSTQDEELEIWVRRFEGGQVSDALTRKRVGEVIRVSPPFGYFRPGEPANCDKLYFATGTGLSPFLAAMRSGAAHPQKLYWGLRHPLKYDFRQLDIPLQLCLSQSGAHPCRITDRLAEVKFKNTTHIYACGLDRMIEEVLGYFSTKGIPESQLHRECFFTAN